MDFRFGKKEEQLRSEIREFVRTELPPHHIAKLYEEENLDREWEFAMSISKKLSKKGWLTLSWPKEYGGMGATCWEQHVFKEEANYWGIPGVGMGVGGTSWVGPSLMLFGTKEQKEKYIPRIAAGEPDGVWCTAYSEPDSGTDMASMQTLAVRDGDEYVINGQKVWTSCAHRANWLWLACRTDPEAKKKHQGLSLFLVNMKSEGLTVRPIKNYVGHHMFNELFFKDVRVPAENLVGVEGKGWSQLMKALRFERGTAIAVSAAGQRYLDELVIYARSTGKIKNPQFRRDLAEMAVDIKMLRLMSREAIWKEDNGQTVIHEASRDKAFGDTLQERLARVGMKVIGIHTQLKTGLEDNNRWTRLQGIFEHLYHYSVGKSLAAGTTFTQYNIVGQFGLQLPKAY